MRRIIVVLLLALVTWGQPASYTHADNSPYLNVWVHYDYMVGPGYSDAPSSNAMQMVVDAFKAHGVTLHIDPQHTAIPGQVIVPDWGDYGRQPDFDAPACTGPNSVRFSTLRSRYFHPSSNHAWHYAIFGNELFSDSLANARNCPSISETGYKPQPPIPSMSGYSEVGFLDNPQGLGYTFVINMKQFRDIGFDVNDPANAQVVAALFMHELGHNLGLCHGGPNLDGCSSAGSGENYKPNYISVMNYDFEFGIPYAASPGSTGIAGYRVDYSDVRLPDLNESCLNETAGLRDTTHPTDLTKKYGRAGWFPVLGPVDWNEDGSTTDTCLSIDLNGDTATNVLHGADDWSWIHSRLTPPTITSLSLTGTSLQVSGVNLMGPLTVVFNGGAVAAAADFHYDGSPNTSFEVWVPAGAKSGPISVVTPEGTVTSSQSMTIISTASSPQGITSGRDGSLWFTEELGNGIGRITPSGVITQFPLPSPSSTPLRIAAGPSGNLWFTESSANKIGRMTPSGAVTEFPIPTPFSVPLGIATGSDGNLWFTESATNTIGRITPTGSITEFSIPSLGDQGASPGQITAGLDGNLWFTESAYIGSTSVGAVGRITPSGAVTLFSLGLGAGIPVGITAGPDGNLWFTQGGAVRRMTSDGVVTDFAESDVCGGDIATGPDGNLWCFDALGDSVGRITTSGSVTQFPLPRADSLARGIAAGPDGNLWFTETDDSDVLDGSGVIGRITPAGTISEYPIP